VVKFAFSKAHQEDRPSEREPMQASGKNAAFCVHQNLTLVKENTMKNFIITIMPAMLLAVSGATFAGTTPPVDDTPVQQNPTQQAPEEEVKPEQEAPKQEAPAQEAEAPAATEAAPAAPAATETAVVAPATTEAPASTDTAAK
jgi:hypothetical protein